MILLERNLPPMPVNVTGPLPLRRKTPAPSRFGSAWNCEPLRIALKLVFGAECALAVSVVVGWAAIVQGLSTMLVALGGAAVLVVSLAALEMTGRLLDLVEARDPGATR